MRIVIAIVALAAAVALVAVAFGGFALSRRVSREVEALARDVDRAPHGVVSLAAYPDLPAPVRRYLEFAGVEGRERIRFARLRHTGTFRTGPGQAWMPIQGEEYFTAGPPGFVWFAAVRPVPFVPIRARDHYLHGRGSMLVKPLGLFTLANRSVTAPSLPPRSSTSTRRAGCLAARGETSFAQWT